MLNTIFSSIHNVIARNSIIVVITAHYSFPNLLWRDGIEARVRSVHLLSSYNVQGSGGAIKKLRQNETLSCDTVIYCCIIIINLTFITICCFSVSFLDLLLEIPL